jgi:hypothetical protein
MNLNGSTEWTISMFCGIRSHREYALIIRVNAGISAAGDRFVLPAMYCKTAAGATTGRRIGINYNEC